MKILPLSNTDTKWAIVDDDVIEDLLQWSWGLNQKGYIERRYKQDGVQKVVFLHRWLLGDPEGFMVDHVSGDTMDCRRENLRSCTPLENARNSAKSKSNTSGFKGVTWNKQIASWAAQIAPNYKNIILGYFDDPVQAAQVHNAAAVWYFSEFARLNEVPGYLEEWVRLWVDADKKITRTPNSSGYRGVSWSADRKKWEAYITKDKKRRALGRYRHKAEAAMAYNRAASGLYGGDARLNDISQVDLDEYLSWKTSGAQSNLRSTNTTGFSGVSPAQTPGKWRAAITWEFGQTYLGQFNTSKEAAYVVDQVRLQLFPNTTAFNVLEGHHPMTTTPRPPEDQRTKGGNATLKLYGVVHFQRMGKLSAAKRKQVMGIGERPAMTHEEITTEVQRLVEIAEENEAQQATCKEDNGSN